MPAITEAEVREEAHAFTTAVRAHGREPHGLEVLGAMGLRTLDALFGREWLRKQAGRNPDDLIARFAPPGGYPNRNWVWARIGYLGEALFNLQNVPGFEARLRSWSEMDDIEPMVAETACARRIQLSGVRFRFLDPSAGGGTYDVELESDDEIILASGEFKSKISETEIRTGTAIESLRQGAKQLPPDRAGFLWVHVPVSWVERGAFNAEMEAAINAFLRNRRRVARVLFLREMFVQTADSTVISHWGHTLDNPHCRHLTEPVVALGERLSTAKRVGVSYGDFVGAQSLYR